MIRKAGCRAPSIAMLDGAIRSDRRWLKRGPEIDPQHRLTIASVRSLRMERWLARRGAV